MNANPYVNVYNLQIGNRLCIPVMRPQTRNNFTEGTMPGGIRNNMQNGMQSSVQVENQAMMSENADNSEEITEASGTDKEDKEWMKSDLPIGFYGDIE